MTDAISHEAWELRHGIQGYSWHAPDPRAALLLQHGYSEYAHRYVTRYNRLIPQLLGIEVSVHAFDLQGHGRSTGRRGVTDVHQAVRDHLAARRVIGAGPLPLFVMGHSLGGLVTASSVVLDPGGVSGAIITSGALLELNVLLRTLARVLAAVAPNAPAPMSPIRPERLSRIPEEVEAAMSDPLIHHGPLPNLTAAGILLRAHANRELYRRWTVPTLVLHGTADRITDPEGSRRLSQAIGSRDSTLHLVEGGYHELLNDTDRDETLRVILRWLDRRVSVR